MEKDQHPVQTVGSARAHGDLRNLPCPTENRKLFNLTWLIARHLIEMLNVLMNEGETWVKETTGDQLQAKWECAVSES